VAVCSPAVSVPAVEGADLRVVAMHLHVLVLHYTSSDNNPVQAHQKSVIKKSVRRGFCSVDLVDKENVFALSATPPPLFFNM
jgi:hypothetical protein